MPNTSETLGVGLYVPLVDGYVVPDDPALLVGTNNQSKVPLLIGHNADEGLFYARDLPKTLQEYRAFVRARFPAEFVDAVLARYPAATDADVAVVAPVLETESRFVATAALTARAASKVSDVYMYRFSRVAPSSRSAWGGAAHTTEVRVRLRQHEWGRLTIRRDRSHGVRGNGSGVGTVREDRESKRWRAAAMACIPLS